MRGARGGRRGRGVSGLWTRLAWFWRPDAAFPPVALGSFCFLHPGARGVRLGSFCFYTQQHFVGADEVAIKEVAVGDDAAQLEDDGSRLVVVEEVAFGLVGHNHFGK